MISLAGGRCLPCRGGEPTLAEAEIVGLLPHIRQVVEQDGKTRGWSALGKILRNSVGM